MKIGVLNPGEAPTPGLAEDLRDLIGHEHEIIEVGVLDDLSSDDLRGLAARPGEEVTVAQRADGGEIHVASARLFPLGQVVVTKLEGFGAEVIFPACAGDLPEYSCQVRYVNTFRLLRSVIDVLLPQGRLGLLMPSKLQREKHERWYANPHRQLVIAGASPLSLAQISEAADALAAARPDIVVMTCFLNDRGQRSVVRRIVGCPVLLSRSVVGRVVSDLAG